MRRGRITGLITALIAAAAVAAPGALAATPQQICKDLKDGHLDGHYSAADLARFKADPSVQGYCFLTVTPKSPAKGAAGQNSGPLSASKVKSGGLPFTGAQLTIALIIGSALLAAGVLLRLSSRGEPS